MLKGRCPGRENRAGKEKKEPVSVPDEKRDKKERKDAGHREINTLKVKVGRDPQREVRFRLAKNRTSNP